MNPNPKDCRYTCRPLDYTAGKAFGQVLSLATAPYSRMIFGLVFCLFWGVVFTGCLDLKQPALKVNYHALAYTASASTSRPALPVALKIVPLRAAPAYRSTRMVYQPAPHAREAFVYHRWDADPGRMLTDWLYQDLQYSGLFQAVVTAPSALPVTHMLEGTVDAFYAQNTGGAWASVLKVSLTLLALDDNRIIFQQPFSTSVPLDALTPQAFARSMSAGMQTLSAEMIEVLYAASR